MKRFDENWEERLHKSYMEEEIPLEIHARIEDTLRSLKDSENSSIDGEDQIHDLPKRKEEAKVRKISNYRSWKKMAVIASAAVFLVGGTAFAAEKLYQLALQKQAAHEQTVTLTTEETLPEELPKATVKVNYVPEGYQAAEKEGPYSYINEEGNAGFMIGEEPMVMDSADPLRLLDVVDTQQLEIGGREAFSYTQKHGTDEDWLNTHIYVLYPEEHRMIDGFAWGYADEKELEKMLEQTELILSDEMIPTAEQFSWSEAVANLQKQSEDVDREEIVTTIPSEDRAQEHEIGDAVSVPSLVDDQTDLVPVQAVVKDVEITDDVSVLANADVFRDSYSDLIAGGGKLGTDTLNFLKFGDGSEDYSVQTIHQETSPVHLVHATIEYTNTSEEAQNNLLYYVTLLPIKEENGDLSLLTKKEIDGADSDLAYDQIENETPMVGSGDMVYGDVNGETSLKAKNHITSLAPGETVTVHVAFLVNDYQIHDALYLDLSGASTYSIRPESLEMGLVKVQ